MKDQSQIDNRSFIHVKLCGLLPKGERRLYRLHPEPGRTLIVPNPDHGKVSLEGLRQRLQGDAEIMERYTLTYDPEANEIRLGFRAAGFQTSQWGTGVLR